MRSLPRIMVAWGVGWTVYLAAAVSWGYDGLISLVLQPICAALVSTASVGAVLVAGLVFRVRPVGRCWDSHPGVAGFLIVGCLAVMGGGSAAGLTGDNVNPDTGAPFKALHPIAALGSYFLLLFVLAHWPISRAAPMKSPNEWGDEEDAKGRS